MDIQIATTSFNPKLKGEILIIQGHTDDTLLNGKFVVVEVNHDNLKIISLQPFGYDYKITGEDIPELKITHVPVTFDKNFKLEAFIK